MTPLLIPIVSSLLSAVTGTIDKAVLDKDAAEKLKVDITLAMMTHDAAEMQGAVDIIKAEAQGESWLQRNWRPILMLGIVAIVMNNYLVAPYLKAMGLDAPTLDLPSRLWDLMTLGVGGYVGGRSLEKISTSVAEVLKK